MWRSGPSTFDKSVQKKDTLASYFQCFLFVFCRVPVIYTTLLINPFSVTSLSLTSSSDYVSS
jgi:hypothetical protein